jgi:integrase
MSTTVTTVPPKSLRVTKQLSFPFEERPAQPTAIPQPAVALATEAEPAEVEDPPPAPSAVVVATADAEAAMLAPAQPKTLADVAAILPRCMSSPRKLAEAMSGLRMVGRVLGRPLADIPVHPTELRVLLAGASPALAGIKMTRWNRMRSLVMGALAAVGIEVMPGRSTDGLSPAWYELFKTLPNKKLRYGLSRIVSYLSSQDIEPAAVNAISFDRFADALRTASLHRTPETAIRTTARLWTVAVNHVPGWPRLTPKVDPTGRAYALAMDAFPTSFGEDAEAFLDHSGNQDVLADDYAPSVKPSTVAMRRKQTLQCATALVRSGFPIEQITSLAILTQPANAKAALRYLLNRKGGTTTPYLGQQAQLLRTIGKHWVKAGPEEVATLAKFCSGLSPEKQRGMTEKNRALLRQFDLPENVLALLHMPTAIFKALDKPAKERPIGRKDALRAVFAVAVHLLTVTLLRVDNLVGLDLGRHLVEHRRSRNRMVHIVIPPTETKTRMPFERELSEGTIKLLDTYITTYRPLLCPIDSPWLFPNHLGGRRCTVTFSTSISKFILRETGLKMHAHLFRHLGVKLHHAEHPHDIETARRMLGHTTSTTTSKAYSDLRNDAANKRYDETLAKLLTPYQPPTKPKAPTKPRGGRGARQ